MNRCKLNWIIWTWTVSPDCTNIPYLCCYLLYIEFNLTFPHGLDIRLIHVLFSDKFIILIRWSSHMQSHKWCQDSLISFIISDLLESGGVIMASVSYCIMESSGIWLAVFSKYDRFCGDKNLHKNKNFCCYVYVNYVTFRSN